VDRNRPVSENDVTVELTLANELRFRLRSSRNFRSEHSNHLILQQLNIEQKTWRQRPKSNVKTTKLSIEKNII